MDKRRNRETHWTLDMCLPEALKYSTKNEWKKASGSSYNSARKNGWFSLCTSHMVNGRIGLNRKYSLEECLSFSKQFISRQEWRTQHPSSYKCAMGAGWYHQCSAHMTKLKKAWNSIEKCKEIASRFEYRSEWRKASQSSYTYASRNRWLPECTAHMKTKGGISLMEQELLSEIQKKYPSAVSKRFTVKDSKFVAKCFEIDIYVSEINKGVEFNGRYWHSQEQLKKRFSKWEAKDVERYHDLKTDFFKSIGVNIIYIQESDWRIDKTAEISKALDFLGVTNG